MKQVDVIKKGVYLWQIHFDIWQNQYNIVKFKNKIKKKKKKEKSKEREQPYQLASQMVNTHWPISPLMSSSEFPLANHRV